MRGEQPADRCAPARLQYVADQILRTTKTDALVGFDKRPVNISGVLDHRGKDHILVRVRQTPFLSVRAHLAQNLAGSMACIADELNEFLPRVGGLQILDDGEVDAGRLLKNGQRLARSAAIRIVPDRRFHCVLPR